MGNLQLKVPDDLNRFSREFDQIDLGKKNSEFLKVPSDAIFRTLKVLNTKKPSGIVDLSRILLNDGATRILVTQLSQICNLQ